MLEQLRDLTEALEGLAEGQHPRWLAVCPDIDRMEKGTREAVECYHDPETIYLLDRCWNALGEDSQARAAIREHCRSYHHLPTTDLAPVADRLYGNARARIAACCAAVEAKRCTQDPAALSSLVRWLMEGAALFGGSGQTPAIGLGWPQAEVQLLVRNACAALAAQDLPTETMRLWTLDLLGAGEAEISRTITLPFAGCHGKGFLLNLRLSAMRGQGKGLVEHPEMALRTLGKTFLDTLEKLSKELQFRVRWGLQPRLQDERRASLALDGPSLGGALAVGLHLLQQNLPNDPSCLIVAQVHGEMLEAVGFEREKLEVALEGGIRRIVVGAGTEVRSLIADFAARGLEVRELGHVAEAVEFASGQLAELQQVLEAETARVLEDAENRIQGREFESWQALDALFVPVRVARGLRPRLTQDEYEQLERQRREGDHSGLDRLLRQRLDPREEKFQAELKPELRRVTVEWETVRTGFRRAVVLGDAGFGKTMLLWHETGRRNRDWMSRIERSQAGLAQIEVAVFVRAFDLADRIRKGEKLPEALTADRCGRWGVSEATAKLVSTKLAEGAGLIVIDALDEVPVAARRELDAALKEFSNTYVKARVLLSSRLAGYAGAPIPIADEDQFEVLAFEPGQMEQAITAWFNPDAGAAAEAWTHIQSQTNIFGDLRCPLLLRLACGLIAEARRRGSGLPRWERRSDLYEGFLLDGVTRWGTAADPPPGDTASALFLDFAGDVALELWKQDARRTLWESAAIAEEISLAQGHYRALVPRLDLMRDMCDVGILSYAGPKSPKTPLMFTHRSIGEYLTARALAGKGTKPGPANEWNLIDRRSWDSAWEQVILFLAGLLADRPAELRRLIETLADEKTDDVLHYRQTLAAKCLAEIPERGLRPLSTTAQQIIKRTFLFWVDTHLHGIDAAMPALAIADMKLGGQLTGWLLAVLGSPLRVLAIRALEGMRGAAAREDIIAQLLDLLHDQNGFVVHGAAEALGRMGAGAARGDIPARILEYVEYVAVGALGRMGAAVAREDILTRLLEMLHDQDRNVRIVAANALGRMGAAAAREDILTRLLEMLHDQDWRVRLDAAEALGRMGAAAAREDILTRMLDLLHDPYVYSVADALGRMGAAAAREDTLTRLLEMLHDRDDNVRYMAARVLVRMGAGAAREDILTRLLEMLHDQDDMVRYSVAEALGGIGAAAAREDILARLMQMLHDQDRNVRQLAASALGGMGAAAAREDILTRLLEMLHDQDRHVRIHAANALRSMGAATREDILNQLLELLHHQDGELRGQAAGALGGIGAAAAREDILMRLLEMLHDELGIVHDAAVDALGRMGAVAARDVILTRLLELLHGQGRSAAAKVLGRMGAAAARAGILTRLLEMLHDQDWEVRRSAGEALERMTVGEIGLRVFRGPHQRIKIMPILELTRPAPNDP
jgi:HEAT repeat protein